MQTFQANFFHIVIVGYCLYNLEEHNEYNLFVIKAVT